MVWLMAVKGVVNLGGRGNVDPGKYLTYGGGRLLRLGNFV